MNIKDLVLTVEFNLPSEKWSVYISSDSHVEYVAEGITLVSAMINAEIELRRRGYSDKS